MIVVTKEMTDEERAMVLKNRVLNLTEFKDNEKNTIKLDNPDKSIGALIREYARDIGFVGKEIELEGIDRSIKISNKTVLESIHTEMKMDKSEKHDFIPLMKLFTVISEVSKNAILLQVESNRHIKEKSKKIESVKHYIGAFYDNKKLYPVKIIATSYNLSKNISVKLTITVGTIPLEEIKKKGVYDGVHPHRGESHPVQTHPSFAISLPQFLEYFNKNESILIKNFPMEMLSEKQKKIKKEADKHDKKVESDHILKTITKNIKNGEKEIVFGEKSVEKIPGKNIPDINLNDKNTSDDRVDIDD